MRTSPSISLLPARAQPPRGPAWLGLVCGLAVAALAGCAATPAGSRGYASFEQESAPVVLTGARDSAHTAACFEEQGRFLPLSEFSRDGTQFTYRLRVSDLWFEQVRIVSTTGGARAEIRLASNLDSRWRAQFDTDRLQPLRRCLES
jgi:hypothetical protein